MGFAKRAIEDHIESSRERLEPEFVGKHFDEFVKWAFEQKDNDFWNLMTEFCEEVKDQEFWDFCADDSCDEGYEYEAWKESQIVGLD